MRVFIALFRSQRTHILHWAAIFRAAIAFGAGWLLGAVSITHVQLELTFSDAGML